MTNTDTITELMSHMSNQELAAGVLQAKTDLQGMIDTGDRRRLQCEAVFAGGVLLAAELRRRMGVR